MSTVPNLVVTNALACRVYRNAKLGITRQTADELSELTGHRSTLIGNRSTVAMIPLSSTVPQRLQMAIPSPTKPHILEVSKTVELVTTVDYSPYQSQKSEGLGISSA